MKIFRNECYKLLTSPVFIVVSLIAILFTLYTAVGAKPIPISDAEYRVFQSDVADLTNINDQAEYIQGLLEQEMQAENHDLQWRDHVDFYRAELEQAEAIRDYQSYLSDIKASAENITGISIFAEKDSFTYRNAVRIPNSYEQVSSVRPSYLGSEGILLALDNRTIDIVLLLVLFTAVFILIGKERETGIMGVIKPLKNGRMYLCSVKIMLILLIAFVFCLILYAEVFAVGVYRFGVSDSTSPIQSLKGYLTCNLPISIIQAIMIMIAVKCLTAFLFSMLLYLLCTRFSTVTSVVIAIAIIAAEYGLYSQIPFTSNLAPLSGFNLISFLDSANILKNYQSVNFFGYPIDYMNIVVICITVGSIASFIIANMLFSTMKINVKTRSKQDNIFARYVPKKPFSYTIYKFLILHKGLWLILLVTLIQFYGALTLKMPYNVDDRWYKYYCDTIAEMSENEADTFISNEDQRFEALYLNLASPDLSEYQIIQISNELNAKSGYEIAKEQYLYIKTLDSSHKAMFYQTGWNHLFGVNGYKEDMQHTLVLMLSMSLIILPVVSYDRKKNIQYIINATKYGRNLYYRHNITMACIISIILSALCNIPNDISVISLYGKDGMMDSVRCLPMYEKFADIPILGYLLFVIIMRTIIAVLISVIMVYLSSITKSIISALVTGVTAFVLPVLVYLIGYKSAISFCPPLSINHEYIDKGVSIIANLTAYVLIFFYALYYFWSANKITYQNSNE